MINTIFGTFEIHKEKNKITIYGRCSNIINAIKKVIGKTKIDVLLNSYSFRKIEIYDFFLIELYYILKAYLDLNKNKKGTKYKLWYKREVRNLIKLLENETEIHRYLGSTKVLPTDVIDYKRIDEVFSFKIQKHQQILFDNYLDMKTRHNLRGILLDAYVGTGKTFMSLALAEGLNVDIKIIVCPLPTVYDAWVNTLIHDGYKKPQEYYAFADNKEYKGEPNIICHFEALPKLLKLLKKLPKHTTKMVIVDEVHKVTNSKSDRTNFLINLVEEINPKFTLVMSGTTIRDKVQELIPIFQLIDPKFTKPIMARYKKLYTRAGPILVEIGRNRYALIRVKIENTAIQLPPLFTEEVKVKLKKEERFYVTTVRDQMKEYIEARTKELKPQIGKYTQIYFQLRDKAYRLAKQHKLTNEKEFNQYIRNVEVIRRAYDTNTLGDIPDTIMEVNRYERKILLPQLMGDDKALFREARVIYKYLALKLLGEALGKVLNKARTECFIEMAKSINYEHYASLTTKKVLIFTKYIKVAETVEKQLEPYVLGIYGDKAKQLPKIIDQFGKDESKIFLTATYQTMGTGVRVIMANVMLMIDLPYKDYLYKQAVGRMHRLGQDTECYLFKFILDTGEHENISKNTADKLIDNARTIAYLTGKDLGTVVNSETTDIEVDKSKLYPIDKMDMLASQFTDTKTIDLKVQMHNSKFDW
jgi:SNF2 family DNA or RNA helicase